MLKSKKPKTKKPKDFNGDETAFESFVGMITNGEQLIEIDAPIGYDCDTGHYDANSYTLRDLMAFIRRKPKYHIVTLIDTDGGCSLVNRAAIVNRINYYLATRSRAEAFCVVR